MDFPVSNFSFETITNKKYFENIYKIVNVKIHLHHSHVAGKIYRCVHDFCNWKVRESQIGISCIAHNLFSFDFFFLLTGIRFSC